MDIHIFCSVWIWTRKQTSKKPQFLLVIVKSCCFRLDYIQCDEVIRIDLGEDWTLEVYIFSLVSIRP